MTTTFKLAKFSEDAADILVGGKSIGWVEREVSERFESQSSRKRIRYISGYSVMITADTSQNTTFTTITEARDYIANYLAAKGSR